MKIELRRHGTSIVLAIFAIVLGVFMWIDRGTITEVEREKRPKNVLPAFRRDEVSRIEIDKGAEKLVLARDVERDADASWRVESPEQGLADPSSVEQLSSAFEFATFVRKVDPKSAPTFDAPRASGSLVMGKITYRFALGNAAPTPEGASYFKLEGADGGVYVVSKELTEQLLKGAAAYRSRTIVPYLSLDLASLEVRGKATVRIERTGELTFKVASSGLRASREMLDKLWSAFAEMRAESFTDEMVQDATFTITMTPKDGRKAGEILVGGPCKDHPDDLVVTRTAPTKLSACAPKGIVDGLSLTADDLADARLFFAHEDELEELALSDDAGAKIELARKGSGWHARAPFDRDLAGDEVDAANTLASAVIRAKGMSVSVFTPGDFTVRSRVHVKGGEMKDDENVDVGQTASGAWVAHRIADNARIALGDDVARHLKPSKSALKGRDVIQPALDPKDVTALTLRCGVTQDLVRDESLRWKMTSPTGFTADQAAALDLVDQIAHLRADAWIADTDDGAFGFSTSTCSATLAAKGGRSVTLRIGREGENGVYAIANDTPVFLEPRPFKDALARILVDRSGLGLETSRASSIVLSRNGARVELKRAADKFATDAGLPVSVESITSALDVLRADDVVRLGPPAPDEGFDRPSLDVRADLDSDGGKHTVHLRFGRDALRKNQAIVYARVDGVDATFAVARERVDPIRSAL
jgi:hypothetical protein